MEEKELKQIISSQIENVLIDTDLSFAGSRYAGKVRDSYVNKDVRFLITTDRLSCFDAVVTAVPFKGQVLTALAAEWFERVSDIVDHHLLDVPDPNVMVGRNCEVLPVEVVVRGYITGSAWRDYSAGRAVSGITLPAGLRQSEQLPEPVLTPSTKAEQGEHDEPISEAEIIKRQIVPENLWQEIREVALALFKRGQEHAGRQGLILVDTKYEFGLYNNRLMLVDEIHTLDSSRYWIKENYEEKFKLGESPAMLDKEPVRQWLLSQGYSGDGEIPHFSNEYRSELALHYIRSFEQITGKNFEPVPGPAEGRIEKNVRAYIQENNL